MCGARRLAVGQGIAPIPYGVIEHTGLFARVIQKHGGTISVESTLGVGTRFHIFLPASRNLIALETNSPKKTHSRPGRLLVLEDEEGVRRVVGASLRRMGHEVELLADGEQVISAYKNAKKLGRPFDAVILDLTVRAGLGGQETVHLLRRMDPALKAVVMSGHANDPAIVEHERYGFDAALVKPFEVRQLQETISRLVGS